MDGQHTASDLLLELFTKSLHAEIRGEALPAGTASAETALCICCAEPGRAVCGTREMQIAGKTEGTVPAWLAEGRPYVLCAEGAEGVSLTCRQGGTELPVTEENGRRTWVFDCTGEKGRAELLLLADDAPLLYLSADVLPAAEIPSRDLCAEMREDAVREIFRMVFGLLKQTDAALRQADAGDGSPVPLLSLLCDRAEAFLHAFDRESGLPPCRFCSAGSLPAHPSDTDFCVRHHPGKTAAAVRFPAYPAAPESRMLFHMMTAAERQMRIFAALCAELRGTQETGIARRASSLKRRMHRRLPARRSALQMSCEQFAQMEQTAAQKVLRERYQCLMQSVSFGGEALHLPQDFVSLYPVWCFFRLNRILRDRCVLLSQNLLRMRGAVWELSLGEDAHTEVRWRTPYDGSRITLCFGGLSGQQGGAFPVLLLKHCRENEKEEQIAFVPDGRSKTAPGEAVMTALEADCALRGTAFACVLFPGEDEEAFRQHPLYERLRRGTAGALPLLPGADTLLTGWLGALLSPQAELPSDADLSQKDVLVGSLRNREQFYHCFNGRFYHMPADRMPEDGGPVRIVALYQSKRLFGEESGIRFYGEVIRTELVPRRAITEIPKDSDVPYYRFTIAEWKMLPAAIRAKDLPAAHLFTNEFLLTHSREAAELLLTGRDLYRFYHELKRRAAIRTEAPNGFLFHGDTVLLSDGLICVYRGQKQLCVQPVSAFLKNPGRTFAHIRRAMEEAPDSADTEE